MEWRRLSAGVPNRYCLRLRSPVVPTIGKSSLLNRLIHRKEVRASQQHTPGRTREINFFKVNDAFVLADLPGYGYARIAKEKRAEWTPLIEGYLSGSPQLRGIVQLLDVRHDPTVDDKQMLDFLERDRRTDLIVVFTKIDKISKPERAKQVFEISRDLDLTTPSRRSHSAQ